MFENLLKKPESYRKKAALATTLALFAIILFSWSFYEGLITFPDKEISGFPRDNLAASAALEKEALSPMENISGAFDSVFKEFKNEYNALKESLESVFVPFISGIEVYESR